MMADLGRGLPPSPPIAVDFKKVERKGQKP